MEIVLAKELKDSVIESLVDGEGVRLVLFTCGCPHRCKGCHNSETWNIYKGVSHEIDEVVKYLKDKFYKGNFQGITLSGGDPLFQKLQVMHLLKRIKAEIPEADIWVYTGYLFEELEHQEILNYIDVLVDGKFEAEKKYPKKGFRGSNNQRLIRLLKGSIVKID